jgi:hypothetical protein
MIENGGIKFLPSIINRVASDLDRSIFLKPKPRTYISNATSYTGSKPSSLLLTGSTVLFFFARR